MPMKLLDEIRKSGKKPKELLTYLSEKVKKDKGLLDDFSQSLKNGSPVEKGICMEVLEYVSQEKPELVIPYINEVTTYLNYDAPRVKWEAARVVANLSSKYPEKTEKAIGKLMVNTKDKGTVVRWATAFALGEIAKHNKNIQKELIKKIEDIIKKEQNSGVKNVYLKALKVINK